MLRSPLPLLLFFLLPILAIALLYNVAALSFARLGLSVTAAVLLATLAIVGSVINIPVWRQRIEVAPARRFWFFGLIFYYPPQVREQTIYVNVGGAVVPVLFSLYLLPRAPLLPTVIATMIIMIAAKLLAQPMPGVGIVMPAFIPPLLAASLALLLAPGHAGPVAYIAGVLGTLIGADLLNLPAIRRMGAQAVSIGGAGVYDGIFLCGVVAVLLT